MAGAREKSFELAPGHSLGRFRVGERIGAGGMAELYLARAAGPGGFSKLVAIKRILPQLASDHTLVDMFLNEARLAATLDHPNVAQVIDFGAADGEHYLAMEYVHGPNLRRVLQRAAEADDLPLSCALTIAVGVAAGLHHAHEATDRRGRPLEIVHRDVSPSNVIVTMEGGVKVIDFGIARAAAHTSVTHGVTIKGKVGYMSPEQCLGRKVDRRCDVFALGILLWELTTRERLFVGDNQFAVMNQIANGRVVRPSERVPDYPAELEAIVMTALATDPDDRYPTAHAFADAIETFAAREGIQLSPLRLAEYVRRTFPDVPAPSVEDVTERSGTSADTDAPSRSFTRRVRRPWGWVVAALVVGTASGLAAQSLSSNDVGAAEVHAAPADPEPPRSAVTLAQPVAVPPALEPVAAPPPADAQPIVAPPRPAANAKKRGPKRPRRDRDAPPKYDRHALFPPE